MNKLVMLTEKIEESHSGHVSVTIRTNIIAPKDQDELNALAMNKNFHSFLDRALAIELFYRSNGNRLPKDDEELIKFLLLKLDEELKTKVMQIGNNNPNFNVYF